MKHRMGWRGKKQVKTQISYAVNLFGLAEEVHAGGALAFQCRNHGEEFGADSRARKHPELYSFEQMVAQYGELMEVQPKGYVVDKTYPDLIYVPLDIRVDLRTRAGRGIQTM